MEKRYQVFVSSTFADLRDERRQVIQTLMEMDCIPAGMELFPAADEEQFDFIKRVIDDSDYYILIIGERYGSVAADGVSYTQKEYEYALTKGLKVLAFVHRAPDDIPTGKSEADPAMREKLEAFRETVATGRLVKFWTTASELPGLVALSLNKTIKTYPAVGWARANEIANDAVLSDLNDLRKQNDALKARVAELEQQIMFEQPELAGLDDQFEFELTWPGYRTSGNFTREVNATWGEVFAVIGAQLSDMPRDDDVNRRLAESFYRSTQDPPRSNDKSFDPPTGLKVESEAFDTIRLQLSTLGLVEFERFKTTTGYIIRWSITPAGQRIVTNLRAVKRASTSGK